MLHNPKTIPYPTSMVLFIPATAMDGIPTMDSTNNELKYWMRSITNVYSGTDQKQLEKILLVKGDNASLYPVFKSVK